VHSGLHDALPKKIVVDIYHDGAGVGDNAMAILKSHGKDETNTSVFEYSVWANPGEKLTFVPRDSRYIFLDQMFAVEYAFWLTWLLLQEKGSREEKSHICSDPITYLQIYPKLTGHSL